MIFFLFTLLSDLLLFSTFFVTWLGKEGWQKEDFPDEILDSLRKYTMAIRSFLSLLVTCFPSRNSSVYRLFSLLQKYLK